MSKQKKWILLLLLLLGIFSFIVLASGFYLLSYEPVTEIREGSVVEVVLSYAIEELPPESPVFVALQGRIPNLWELGEVFQHAARDDRVSAILLEIHPLAWNWGQIEELRDHIKRFRESGKAVHAFLAVDIGGEQELYLASAADSITINPGSGLLINGLVAEVTFYKGVLEKLKIRPEFIQFKEYKSSEQFSREKLSPEIREMLESVLGDLEDRFVSTVAAERQLEEEALREIMTVGMIPAKLAHEKGLLDSLGYRHEIEEQLKFVGEGKEEYRGVPQSRYLAAARSKYDGESAHRVALLGGLGSIIAGRSEPLMNVVGGTTLADQLRKIREDDELKGVILRVNSPGGSAVGSDMIWKEVRRLEEADKPVIVSMSGVAGSGGYYISMGARRIVTQPSTITGSIGVIFGKFDLQGFYEWLGVSVDRVKSFPNADVLSVLSSMSPDQRKHIENWMETIYEDFVRKAAEGRGLEYDDLEAKARGRIYTGAQARELGLVDTLGGLNTAVSEMKRALDLEQTEQLELVLYPKRKTLLEAALSGELIKIDPPSLTGWFQQSLNRLDRPGPWLLAPDVNIN